MGEDSAQWVTFLVVCLIENVRMPLTAKAEKSSVLSRGDFK